MSEITFRSNYMDQQSSALRERDHRIAELEELLHEAQQIASVGKLDVTPIELKTLSENEHLKRRKNQLTTQLQRLQEEYLLSTSQFDAEVTELRRHLEICELKMLALTERETTSCQTEGRGSKLREDKTVEQASQAEAPPRQFSVSKQTHHLIAPETRRTLQVDQYNNRIHIRKLNLLQMETDDFEEEEPEPSEDENSVPVVVRRCSRLDRQEHASAAHMRSNSASHRPRRPSLVAKIRSAQCTPRNAREPSLLLSHSRLSSGHEDLRSLAHEPMERRFVSEAIQPEDVYKRPRLPMSTTLANSLPAAHPKPPLLLMNRTGRRRLDEFDEESPRGRPAYRRFVR